LRIIPTIVPVVGRTFKTQWLFAEVRLLLPLTVVVDFIFVNTVSLNQKLPNEEGLFKSYSYPIRNSPKCIYVSIILNYSHKDTIQLSNLTSIHLKSSENPRIHMYFVFS